MSLECEETCQTCGAEFDPMCETCPACFKANRRPTIDVVARQIVKDLKAEPGDTTCDWIIHEQHRTCPLKAQWVEPITQRCYCNRHMKKVAFNFGYDQLDPLTTRKKPSVCDMRPADYIRLCKQVGVSGNMGAQLNYETGELTMWPNELQGKGLAVTFALPGVKPANSDYPTPG